MKRKFKFIAMYALGIANYVQFFCFQYDRKSLLTTYASPCLHNKTEDSNFFIRFNPIFECEVTGVFNTEFITTSRPDCLPSSLLHKAYPLCPIDDDSLVFNFGNTPGIVSNSILAAVYMAPIILLPAFFSRRYIQKDWQLTIHTNEEKRTHFIRLNILSNFFMDLIYTNALMQLAWCLFFPFENKIAPNVYSVIDGWGYNFQGQVQTIQAFASFLTIVYGGFFSIPVYFLTHFFTLCFTTLKNDWNELRRPKAKRMRLINCSQKCYFLLIGFPMILYLLTYIVKVMASLPNIVNLLDQEIKNFIAFTTLQWNHPNLRETSTLSIYLTYLIGIAGNSLAIVDSLLNKQHAAKNNGSISLTETLIPDEEEEKDGEAHPFHR